MISRSERARPTTSLQSALTSGQKVLRPEELVHQISDEFVSLEGAVLGIPDNYGYMDAELVRLLRLKCAPYLP